MCAAVVLRPQDCLRRPFPPRRNADAANCNPKNAFMSHRRKRSPTRAANPDRKSPSFDAPAPKNNLVMGQVKILKRGEALQDLSNEFTKPDPPAKATATATATEKPVTVVEKPVLMTSSKELGFVDRRDEDDMIFSSTGRMGPDPETVRMQIKASDFFAGLSPTMASPPPSSVPFPGFFRKEKAKTKVDSATNDILRLLRLDIA